MCSDVRASLYHSLLASIEDYLDYKALRTRSLGPVPLGKLVA